MHHYWLFRFNSEILIWKVSFSKSETHVWNFSGYTTDINPVLYIYWILNALLQNKIPRGPTWPVVSRSAPLTSAPVTPSTLLLAPQAPGPWLSFLFLRGVKLISISPWSLLADWTSVKCYLKPAIIEQSLKALTLPPHCPSPDTSSIIY